MSEIENRFVPLHDGRPGLRETVPVEIREPAISENSCNSCLEFTASDATLDRYHEIIVPAGWRLDTYNRNPVFQNAHQYGDIIFTLGRAVVTEVRSGTLLQRIQFATDVNPMAKIAYGLYKGKFLNAVSVGFIPLRWETPNGNPEGMKEISPGQTRNECRPGYDLTKENPLSPSEGERVGVRGSGTPKFRRRY